MMIVKASAKVNLALNIESARADGYHNLKMIMQSVDLCDALTVDFKENAPLCITCNMQIEGENLVKSAVDTYSAAINRSIGGKIHIEKHIPLCSGLGGGSADAAATLKALQKQYGGVDDAQLAEMALSLGADVPFALVGGTQYALGVGERLQRLPTLDGCAIVLASLGEKDSTGKMFARFDNSAQQLHPDTEKAVLALKNGDLAAAAENFQNSFYPIWMGSAAKRLEGIMRKNGAFCVSLSGAGPTLFGIFKKDSDAANAVNEIEKSTWCVLCHPTENSVIFE